MSGTEHVTVRALPLADAAAHLGITTDALRMRLRRGKARGFKHDRHVYVYLTEQDLAAFRGGSWSTSTEAGTPEAGTLAQPTERGARTERTIPEQTRFGRARSPAATPEISDPPLPTVVEFQKLELTRLLRENERLNVRLDLLLEEARHFRQMQQREQILRQQDQNLRQQLQATLDKLTDALALPRLAPPRLGALPPELERPISGPPDSGPPDSGPPDSGPPDRAASLKSAASAITEGASDGAFGFQGPRPTEPRAEAAPTQPGGSEDKTGTKTGGETGNGATEGPIKASPPPAVTSGEVTGAPARDGPARDGSDFAERETEELSDLLRSLGESLRDLDATQVTAPPGAGPAPGSVSVGAADPEPSATQDPLLLRRRVPHSAPLRDGPSQKAPLRGRSGHTPGMSQGKKSRFLKRLFGSRSESHESEGPGGPTQSQGS